MSDIELVGLSSLLGTTVSAIVETKLVYENGNEIHDLPSTFREVQAGFPVVQSILLSIQTAIQERKVDEVPRETLRLIAVTCEEKVRQLSELSRKAIATEATPNLTLWYEAVRTSQSDQKVKSLMHGILLDVQLLVSEISGCTTTRDQREQILQVIKDFSKISDHGTKDLVGGKLGPTTHVWARQQVDFCIVSNQKDESGEADSQADTAPEALGDSFGRYRQSQVYPYIDIDVDVDVDRAHHLLSMNDIIHGTCQWIHSNTIFLGWESSRSRFLWITGAPGLGKTMLSVFLSAHFRSSIQPGGSTVLLTYFCDDKNPYQSTGIAILKVLIYQLVEHKTQLLNYLRNGTGMINLQKPSADALWAIFERMILDPALETIYLVLDGLRDWEETSLKFFLSKLAELVSTQDCLISVRRLKVILCSREQPAYISTILFDTLRIILDHDAKTEVSHDVDRLIYAKVEEISKQPVPWPESLRRHVRNDFRDRAQGNFLWVTLVAQILARKVWTEVEAELVQVPSGLNQLFAHLLLRMGVQQRRVTSEILKWVHMAKRPLSLTELGVAVEVQPGEGTGRKPAEVIKDHIAHCGQFLRLGHTRKSFRSKWEEHVYFVSQSARDYVLRNGCADRYAVTREIAVKCFQLLQDDSLWRAPLLSYAVVHWHVHAKDLDAAEDMFQLSLPFYQGESKARDRWLTALGRESLDPAHSGGEGVARFPLLHAAAYLGLLPVVHNLFPTKSRRYLWSKKQKSSGSVNQLDAVGVTALARAAQGGHMAVVKLLLEKQADIEMTGADQRVSPLLLALEERHETIAQLLIERGADVGADKTTPWFDHHTALDLAAKNGLTSTVQMLLCRQTVSQVRATLIETALKKAAFYGHESLVRSLLLHPGAVYMRGKDGRDTALMRAAFMGEPNIMEILLTARADVEARDEAGMSALFVAVDKLEGSVQERAIRLLLQYGADIEAKIAEISGIKDATALLLATRKGEAESVLLLLNLGADIQARDFHGMTALMYAIRDQEYDIASLLVNAGARIEERDNKGCTALMYASMKSKLDAANLLLWSGADTETRDNHGRTVLMQVIGHPETGTREFVELLLKYGADLEARDNEGRTILMQTVDHRREDLAEFVLTKGADVQAKHVDGRSILIIALERMVKVRRPSELMTRLLLHEGADAQVVDARGLTALILAKRGFFAAKKKADSFRNDLEDGSSDHIKYQRIADNFRSICSLIRSTCPDLDRHKRQVDVEASFTKRGDSQSTDHGVREDVATESEIEDQYYKSY